MLIKQQEQLKCDFTVKQKYLPHLCVCVCVCDRLLRLSLWHHLVVTRQSPPASLNH